MTKTAWRNSAIIATALLLVFACVVCAIPASLGGIYIAYSRQPKVPATLAPAAIATAVFVPTVTPMVANVLPTVQPTQPAVPVATDEWVPYDKAGGIPYSGTTWAVDVAPDEIEVLTAGPACIAGVCLPGGTERGSLIILLPGAEVIHYEVTGLIAGSNWHGAYRPLGDPANESTWRALANDRISAMQQAPNCTPGTGCKVIDVLVVGPNGVVAQWVIGG